MLFARWGTVGLCPGFNGAKIRAVWDVLPRRGYRTQPRVSTLGNIQKKQFALKGREITWAKYTRNATEKE
jgi:hypothetical protein